MDFLFLYGTPNDSRCYVMVDENGKLETVVTGSSNIARFLTKLPGKKHVFFLSGATAKQNFKLAYKPTVLINEISDPDSHVVALEKSIDFCSKLQCPVFNSPQSIKATRRDRIYDNLKDIGGLRIPKTVRFKASSPDDVKSQIQDNQFAYPVIFRKAGDHGGISTSLINAEEDLETALYSYALDDSAFYLTEFVDYADSNKLYKKYRIVVVEGKPFIRHMIVSDNWLIHASSRNFMADNPQYQEEEAQLLASFEESLSPKIETAVKAVYDELNLDYFGIDCCISDSGEMLVFEINANMNILINTQDSPNLWEVPIEKITYQIGNLIMRKAIGKA